MGKRETKFTTGPWRCEGPDQFGDFNILHPADSLAVAAVVSNMRAPEEVAANAHLIAAAPDLYGALKAVEWGGEDDLEEGGHVPCCPQCGAHHSSGEHHPQCALAAALAKAQGGGEGLR